MYSIKLSTHFCGNIIYCEYIIQQSLTFLQAVLPLQFSSKCVGASGTIKIKKKRKTLLNSRNHIRTNFPVFYRVVTSIPKMLMLQAQILCLSPVEFFRLILNSVVTHSIRIRSDSQLCNYQQILQAQDSSYGTANISFLNNQDNPQNVLQKKTLNSKKVFQGTQRGTTDIYCCLSHLPASALVKSSCGRMACPCSPDLIPPPFDHLCLPARPK